jgi:hypothetical protein
MTLVESESVKLLPSASVSLVASTLWTVPWTEVRGGAAGAFVVAAAVGAGVAVGSGGGVGAQATTIIPRTKAAVGNTRIMDMPS